MEEMTMTELRAIAKTLNLKGTTSYLKYRKNNKHILIEDIRQRIRLKPLQIILVGMPLLYLRDEVRRMGIHVSRDVGEFFRMNLVNSLCQGYWRPRDLSELETVGRLRDRLLKMRYVTYADNTKPLVTSKSEVK